MGDFHSSVNESDLVDGLDLWGKSTMDAENLALDDSADSKVVENLRAIFPWVGISILSNGFIVETVDGSDLSSLVVASEQGDVSWVLHLQAKEELESFNGVESSIDEITHEDVSSIWNLTTLVEKLKKIVELTVDISTDGYWSLDWLDITLLNENFLDLFAKNSQFSFW